MLVFVDEREIVATGYTNSFGREGVSVTAFFPDEFHDWVNSAGAQDIDAVEAFLIGDCRDRHQFCLLYTSPSPRDGLLSRMPSSA